MTMTPRPASGPAYVTVPEVAERTCWPGEPRRSRPRWPGSQGLGGGSNPRTTSGRGLSGQTASGCPGAMADAVGAGTRDALAAEVDVVAGVGAVAGEVAVVMSAVAGNAARAVSVVAGGVDAGLGEMAGGASAVVGEAAG